MLDFEGLTTKRRIAQERGKCDTGRRKGALVMQTKEKPRIALLAAPETTPSVVFGLYDVLSAAGPSTTT